MNLRIVSDLHVDVNRQGNFGFRHETQDILLIAGDVAGSYYRELKWLQGLSKDIVNPIFVVAGNHLGYEYLFDPEHFYDPDKRIGTKQWSIDYLKKNTPENIHYLDNNYYDIGEYIIFGGCMYSDYKLYENIELSKTTGESYLNDFKYVYVFDKKKNMIRPITTDDYQKYHASFMRRLKKCIKETDKDIIVLTHFAPSPQSISTKYQKGNVYANASYCSNMEQFILDNSRIKYWIHGHMHDSFDYFVGNCHVLCEPYGYSHENKIGHRRYVGKLIQI